MALRGDLRVVSHVPQAFAELVTRAAPRSIALSGGATARECYALLGTAANVDWSVVEVFFGDERWVPVHDPDSNEGMARLAFLDEVQPAAIHSLYGAGATPEAAAGAYDRRLRGLGRIDLVHLGLGADGHTASLFPGAPALDERERLVVPTEDATHPHRRLTFTLPAIARSGVVVFTVAGADKRDAFARVRAGDDLPAARVHAERIVWIVDADVLG
jgi:6-phosphogluconolactonase